MQMQHYYADQCTLVFVTVFMLSLEDRNVFSKHSSAESYTARHYAALFSLYLLSTLITRLIPHCMAVPAFSGILDLQVSSPDTFYEM